VILKESDYWRTLRNAENVQVTHDFFMNLIFFFTITKKPGSVLKCSKEKKNIAKNLGPWQTW